MGTLQDLEDTANLWNDDDASWWPFVFLRPEKHEPVGTLLVAYLASLYGGLFGLAGDVLLASLRAPLPLGSALALPISITVSLFALYRLTFVVAWNRRAARLARRMLWISKLGLESAHATPRESDREP